MQNIITWDQKQDVIFALQQYKQTLKKEDLEVFEQITIGLFETFDIQAWEMLIDELHVNIIKNECSQEFAKKFLIFAKVPNWPIGNGSWKSSVEGLLPIMLQMKLQALLNSIKL